MSKSPLNKKVPLLSSLLPVCLLLFLLLLSLPQAVWAEAFVIENYQADVEVKADHSYHIEEELEVNFSQARHGIFRDIPLTFSDQPVAVQDIRVQGHPVSISKTNQAASLRIGDPDLLVQGRQIYPISYTLRLAEDRREDQDLFYLNLIGNQWDTRIEKARITVTLPYAADLSQLNVTRGQVSSEDTEGVSIEKEGQTFTVSISRPLGPGEGVTAYLPLVQGYYDQIPSASPLIPWALALVSLLLLVFSYLIWKRKGKDDPLIISPNFYPPDHMTPAEAGYIIDRTVDNMDVTSLIVYWADQGYLDIEEDGKKDLILYKKKDLPPEAKTFERYFFNSLFARGKKGSVSTQDLEGSFYEEMATTQSMVAASFTDKKDRRLYAPSSLAYRALLTFLAFFPPFLLSAYLAYADNNFLLDGGVIVLSLLISFLPLLGISFFFHTIFKKGMISKGGWLARLILSSLISLMGLSLFFGFSFFPAPFPFLIISLSLILSLALAQATLKRTPYGHKIKEAVLGHKMFLETAEKDRLEMLLDQDPAYFYHVLPFAQVLHVTKAWSKKFEGLEVQPPDWYRGQQPGLFNAYLFSSTLNRSLAATSQSLATNPASNSGGSGFSGGGFSGGGAGGGGGGSW